MKNGVECYKDFFGYFNALKTNCGLLKKKASGINQKKLALSLDSQLLTVQILTNDVQVLNLCLSYLITTLLGIYNFE